MSKSYGRVSGRHAIARRDDNGDAILIAFEGLRTEIAALTRRCETMQKNSTQLFDSEREETAIDRLNDAMQAVARAIVASDTGVATLRAKAVVVLEYVGEHEDFASEAATNLAESVLQFLDRK